MRSARGAAGSRQTAIPLAAAANSKVKTGLPSVNRIDGLDCRVAVMGWQIAASGQSNGIAVDSFFNGIGSAYPAEPSSRFP